MIPALTKYMNKDNLRMQEFLPSQVMERRAGLERKRLEYLEHMDDQTAPWASVRDLQQRHSDFEDFRSWYYKFFITCQVLQLIPQKNAGAQNSHAQSTEARSFNSWILFRELYPSFENGLDAEAFEQASDTIHKYVTGEIPI